MKKLAGILVLLLFIPVSVDSQQPILVIELSSDGEATVTQLLSAKSIVSSISVPLISDRTSKVLATDERGILLKTTQSGDSLNVATLGASAVSLTYKADITSFDSQAWNVSYEADTETVVVLPQLATIVSVSSIPLDIEDNAVIMPPGPVSITYVINEVSSKTFFVLEGGQNYLVEITSASNIDDFFKQSNEIRFRISGSSTILVVVPSAVLPNPIDASLNGAEVSFNPYYHNGTHNWIRIDPHESGVIEIGGDVRASQVISDNPMTNEGSGENDSIFLTIGIILGVLAVGYVVFRKYFKIGLVRTSSSKDSNRSVKSLKHVKKDMKSGHFGILALVSLSLLLTVPSAFADEPDPYSLMLQISDGQTNLENLEALAADNSFTVDWGDYNAGTFVKVAELAASEDPDDWIQAQAVLDAAEKSHDSIYNQFYEQIEEQQEVRRGEYVMNAESSLTFLIEHGLDLGLSQPTIDQMNTVLQIVKYGTDVEMDAATGQIGITLSVLPNDLSLPSSFTTGSGAAEQLKSKLPPGIAKKYGYSTDSDPSTVSYEGAGNGAGENNGNELPPGYDKKIRDDMGNLIEKFEDTNLPGGFKTKFDAVAGFLDPEVDANFDDVPGGIAKKLAAGDALPKGFVKKYNAIAELYGFEIYDPFGDIWWSESGDGIFDDYDKVKKAKKAKKAKKDKTNNGNGGSGGSGGSGDDKCPPGQAKKGNC